MPVYVYNLERATFFYDRGLGIFGLASWPEIIPPRSG